MDARPAQNKGLKKKLSDSSISWDLRGIAGLELFLDSF